MLDLRTRRSKLCPSILLNGGFIKHNENEIYLHIINKSQDDIFYYDDNMRMGSTFRTVATERTQP